MLKFEEQTANSKQQTAGNARRSGLRSVIEGASFRILLSEAEQTAKSKEQTADSKQQTSGSQLRAGLNPAAQRQSFPVLLFAVCCLLFAATAACRSDMQDQPKMKPYRSSVFFRDGLSSRPPVEGTVARGFLKTDTEFFTGKKAGRISANVPGAPTPSTGPQPTSVTGAPPQGAAAYPDGVEVFPIQVTKETVLRGKERYEIFCTACHGLTGNGDGMIVRRGFRRAASFNDDRLRQAPVGHFFDAITNGWGAMPSYAPQIPPADRWAIVAYIRALQLSQAVPQPSASPATKASANSEPGGHQQ